MDWGQGDGHPSGGSPGSVTAGSPNGGQPTGEPSGCPLPSVRGRTGGWLSGGSYKAPAPGFRFSGCNAGGGRCGRHRRR